MDNQTKAVIAGKAVAKGQQRLELPRGVDMQQRERRFAGIERARSDMRHPRAVLARREQHHRITPLCHRFAQDIDRLEFEAIQM